MAHLACRIARESMLHSNTHHTEITNLGTCFFYPVNVIDPMTLFLTCVVLWQVSKLVILHEDAEDGNAMPDLARPVQVVKMAVDNLIKVSHGPVR